MSLPISFGRGVRWGCGCEGLMEEATPDRFVLTKVCYEDRHTDD